MAPWGVVSQPRLAVGTFWAIAIPDSGNMQPVRPSICTHACRPADAISRALSFWQYQIHQEGSYQQSVLKYANEKNAQLQKQLDNVIREGTRASSVSSLIPPLIPILKANGELNLLNNKIQGATCGERQLYNT